MKAINKKTWVVIISAVIAFIIILFGMQVIFRKSGVKATTLNSSSNTASTTTASTITINVPVISSTQSSSGHSTTSVTVDVTQSMASNSSSKTSITKIVPSDSSRSTGSSSNNTESKSSSSTTNKPSSSSQTQSSSTVASSNACFPPVPTSQEYVTKKVGNNTIRLNVNAFTFEAFVDWSDVQAYLLDDFYVKVYKNGVLKSGPDLYGCVATEPTNTVAVEIDTYKASDGNWYIEPATYTIECYCQLGEHSLVTQNRPDVIPCPSATFSVAINERGFQ